MIGNPSALHKPALNKPELNKPELNNKVARGISSSTLNKRFLIISILLCASLSSCRFTTFPLIPEVRQGTFPARFSSSGIKLEGEKLELVVSLASDQAGYASIIWFENDKEMARDSHYVDAKEPQATFDIPYQKDKYYRAMLLFNKTVLRQFEYGTPPNLQLDDFN
jgi:hypothetical protein